MPTFSLAPLTDAVIAFKKGITLQQGRQLRDNPLAIAEGDPTAPRIQDAALDTGAPTAAGIAWVGLRTAALAAGAVGSYGFFSRPASTSAAFGATTAGSGLTPGGLAGNVSSPAIQKSGATQSGTWRCMGHYNAGASQEGVTLWLRIS